MKSIVSYSFLRGCIRAIDLFGTKEWPSISEDKSKDYLATRHDWENVGKDIEEGTGKYGKLVLKK